MTSEGRSESANEQQPSAIDKRSETGPLAYNTRMLSAFLSLSSLGYGGRAQHRMHKQ